MSMVFGWLQIKSQHQDIPLGFGVAQQVLRSYRAALVKNEPTFHVCDVEGHQMDISVDEFVRVYQS
jgi:hypothetical protein